MKDWGKVMVGVRFEKMVEADFVRSWTRFILDGLRPGDAIEIPPSAVAHKASNNIVRKLLESDCDSVFFLDSDADVKAGLLSELRDYEPGWQYDGFQAFYTARGWPPQAVWYERNNYGQLMRSVIFDEDFTDEVAYVGTHACLLRREIFEAMLGDNDPDKFEWFYYPRHHGGTEDAAMCIDAKKNGDFHFGATTAVKTHHIGHMAIGWEAYQDYLHTSGQAEQFERYNRLINLLVEWTGLSGDEVAYRVSQGSQNVKESWDKAQPQSAEELRVYYQDKENGYLFDLANWNWSLFYINLTRGLTGFKGYNALVIGGGLGSEAEILAERNAVDVFELPGHLKEFCSWRLGDQVTMLNGNTLPEAIVGKDYDLIVAIDTFEHIHPDELQPVLDAIDGSLEDGGYLYCHNNWGQQDIYPMHFDHSKRFEEWAKSHNLNKKNDLVWVKGEQNL